MSAVGGRFGLIGRSVWFLGLQIGLIGRFGLISRSVGLVCWFASLI